MQTERITERVAIAASVPPQTVNNANKTTGSVDMSNSRRAFFILEIGAVTGGGSIDAKLVESVNSDLSSPSDVGGSNVSITGLTTANKQHTFEIRADQVTKRYVGLKVTETGSQNVYVSVVAYGDEGNHKPNNANNDATVVNQKVAS